MDHACAIVVEIHVRQMLRYVSRSHFIAVFPRKVAAVSQIHQFEGMQSELWSFGNLPVFSDAGIMRWFWENGP